MEKRIYTRFVYIYECTKIEESEIIFEIKRIRSVLIFGHIKRNNNET